MRSLILTAIVAVALVQCSGLRTTNTMGTAHCGTTCSKNFDCASATADACTVCRNSRCVSQCGATCEDDRECGPHITAVQHYTNNSCSFCYFNRCGSPGCGMMCTSDSSCDGNPFCKKCLSGACSGPATPRPSSPPTPAPVTPVPTPPRNSTLAFGALYCSSSGCGTSSEYSMAFSVQGAEAIAKGTCGDGTDCNLINVYAEPQPCMALVLNSDYSHYYYRAAVDRGTAITASVKQCRKRGHSTCFVLTSSCARLPPYGARWAATACSTSSGSASCEDTSVIVSSNGTGFVDRPQAMAAAVAACNRKSGDNSCIPQDIFYNCAAIAASPGGAASGYTADKLSVAMAGALKNCNFLDNGNNNCQLKVYGCVAPYSKTTVEDDQGVTGHTQVAHLKV